MPDRSGAKAMGMRKADLLRTAMQERMLVRLARRFEASTLHGYVLDIGPKFFLLAVVSDRIWLDGYECCRITDIRTVKPDPHSTFIEAALRARCEDPRLTHPPVKVDSLENLLRSASAAFPLVTVHTELIKPDACWIGKVLSVKRGLLSLLPINPDATWERAPEDYRLSDITRVDFGGDYEEALHLVGGSPNSEP